ncbi:voltage-dependent anion channel-domain-containing protein [Mariannaea sp. PMI_226]|nr:voltage-dependent anion channel-domain-containing protein [Mariannaea sp. PMI_226]
MDRRDLDALWVDSNAPTRRNSTDSLHAMITSSSVTATHDDRNHVPKGTDLTTMPPIMERVNPKLDVEKNLDDSQNAPARLSLRERLHHFTWAWFTLPMSSGGISLLIYAQPYQFTGLKTIGTVIYSINLVIFTIVCLAMLCRFIFNHGDVTSLITSTERFAIPKNSTSYIWATEAIFWVYVVVTFVLVIAQYIYLFAGPSYALQTMMPGWILPVFPVMLTGTVASVILEMQHNINPLPIIVAGLTCQGLGFSIAIMMYAHMIGRLMQSGLPSREHRTGLFMCVGPPAFTALALIGLADRLPEDLVSDQFAIDVKTVRAVALFCAIFLWALSFWWFLIAGITVALSPPKHFHLGWWPLVFPNTGFTLATISIGNQFQCAGILWFSVVLSILVIVTFCVVLYFNIRAVIVGDIMWVGKDEDADDH